MKAVGIAGSPRKNGNSSTIMRAVIDKLACDNGDAEEVYLNSLNLKGCLGCEKCSTKGCCVLKDDLTDVLNKLKDADLWVLASPIYYDSVTGQFKTFFDRCRTFTKNPTSQQLEPQLKGAKKAVIIITYADNPPRPEYLREIEKIKHYLKWMGNFSDIKVIFQGNLDAVGAIKETPNLLDDLIKNL